MYGPCLGLTPSRTPRRAISAGCQHQRGGAGGGARGLGSAGRSLLLAPRGRPCRLIRVPGRRHDQTGGRCYQPRLFSTAIHTRRARSSGISTTPPCFIYYIEEIYRSMAYYGTLMDALSHSLQSIQSVEDDSAAVDRPDNGRHARRVPGGRGGEGRVAGVRCRGARFG